MENFLDFIITALFIALIAFFVIGFNKQMLEKNKQREEKYKNLKDKK
ncbi:hypothetical protein [Campylobacter sp. MIT 99-7217]|nr:hypothetical protein [Campylobacter sp. MIT 99-7217]